MGSGNMRPNMRMDDTRCSSRSVKLFSLLTVVICVLVSGCRWGHSTVSDCRAELSIESTCGEGRLVWSTEAKSPDGKVLAKACTTDSSGGFSILDSTFTTVYLAQATGSSHVAQKVLSLGDAADTDETKNTRVEMNWITPTHLELTVKGNQTVVFQAVKCFGIDISTRDLSKTD
jgi:hypothetical protein